MLLWEIDRSLADLMQTCGFDRAANVYRRSLDVARSMTVLVESLALPCSFARRNALYLAPADAGETGLQKEHALRERAGLPGRFLDHATLREEFGFIRAAALLSPHAAEADPLRLAQALLLIAISRGARVFDAEAVDYDCAGRSVGVQLNDGRSIEAKHVVLATGYVMPDFLPPDLHRIVSSFAVATPAQDAETLWRDRVLIWEASQNYLYARTTAGGRIIAGGEDDRQAIEPDARDALMPAKAEAIQRRLSALWPKAARVAEYVWSGAFGSTEDGLPLIGRVPGHPGILAAYGYGGNGITFSYLAAQVIGELITGRSRPWFDDFAIDRDAPK
jgi:glycine/D-amino acid oxidase-like deaminating enzyme